MQKMNEKMQDKQMEMCVIKVIDRATGMNLGYLVDFRFDPLAEDTLTQDFQDAQFYERYMITPIALGCANEYQNYQFKIIKANF